MKLEDTKSRTPYWILLILSVIRVNQWFKYWKVRHTDTYIKSMAISEFYFISIIMAVKQKMVFLIKKLIGTGSVRRRRKWWQDAIQTDRRWSVLMAGREWSWLSIVSIGYISRLYRCWTWGFCSYHFDANRTFELQIYIREHVFERYVFLYSFNNAVPLVYIP